MNSRYLNSILLVGTLILAFLFVQSRIQRNAATVRFEQAQSEFQREVVEIQAQIEESAKAVKRLQKQRQESPKSDLAPGDPIADELPRLEKLLAEKEKERAEIESMLDSSQIQIVEMYGEEIERIFDAKCVRIIDGDTIVCLDESNEQFKVRLLGVDTPERGEPFSDKAKQLTGELCHDKTVTIYQGADRDPWGRVLAFAIVDDKNVSVELLRAGIAKHNQNNEDETLAGIEESAKADRVGQWAD